VDSFTPVGRYAHSSALIRNKLVFFGGINDKGFCLNEVFYLDLSRSFNIVTPPWIDLTLNSRIPFKSCWGTVSPNDKEQIIYLFGGIMFNATDQDFFVSVVHSFNLNSLSWNIPNVKGITPKRRRNIQSVIDNYGKMYIFGGYADNDLGLETSLDYNDMVILNTVELSWENYIINSPKHRDLYTATLLTSGVIVYIGGFEYGLEFADIKKIILYDTNSLTCVVENRVGHSAVLAPDGKIIIYGGRKDAMIFIRVSPDIFVINMETEQFELTVPPVTSNIGKVPPSLTCHTANQVDNYMIVAFGNITQPNSDPLPLPNPDIYIMDTRNFTWVNSFEITSANVTTNSKPSITTQSSPTASIIAANYESKFVTMKIIVASIGGILGLVIIIVSGFLIFRWNVKRKALPPRHINEEHTLPGDIVEHDRSSYILAY
ncbi:12942_t:CDS:2, partial [Funneliformis geosporum]